jgi:thiol-disulfide isomerase/thioredoxin
MVKASLPAVIAALLASALLNRAQAQQTALYDFWSPTCGPCRRMEPTVARLISAGFPVQKINIMGSSEERAIAAQYHIQRVPCFVMVANGQEVDRVVGSTSYSRLEQMVRRASTSMNVPSLPIARGQSPDALPPNSPWARHAPEMTQSPSQTLAWPPTATENPEDTGSHAMDAGDSPQTGTSVYGQSGAGRGRLPVSDPRHESLIEMSVRLRVGDATGHSWGTGTIIDKRSGEALVVTCGHLFREMQDDSGRELKVEVELFEWTPGGPQVVARLPGEVISYDLESDIGLVSIRPGREVPLARVAGPQTKLTANLAVCSVGCDHGANPTAIPTHVTAINRYLGPPNIEAAGAPVVGRSGGGLFNPKNELIGVCNAAEHEGNEGLYAGLESIHRALDRIGLSEVYQNAAAPVPAAATGTAAVTDMTRETTATIVRGQEPGQTEHFLDSSRTLNVPVQPSVQSTPETQEEHELSPMEAAAWDEVIGRAAEAEVVCIIRPKEPGGQSEIITLNQMSAEFVRRLREAEQIGDSFSKSVAETSNVRTSSGESAPSSPWGEAR